MYDDGEEHDHLCEIHHIPGKDTYQWAPNFSSSHDVDRFFVSVQIRPSSFPIQTTPTFSMALVEDVEADTLGVLDSSDIPPFSLFESEDAANTGRADLASAKWVSGE